jgi:hypothetical protein
MNPATFHLDWERTFEVMATLVVLAFMLERALSLLFENRRFLAKCDDKGVKELIAYGSALVVCWVWAIDAVSTVLGTTAAAPVGYFISAGIIAGGSKASLRLFHDILGVRSTALEETEARKREEAEARSAAVVAAAAVAASNAAAKPQG